MYLFIKICATTLCIFCGIIVIIGIITKNKIYTYKSIKVLEILVMCGYFALLMLNIYMIMK